MNQIDLSEIKIKLYNERIDLNEFSCEDEDLDEFLKEDSIRQQDFMLSSTYIAIYENEVIGFFTISTDNIPLKSLEKDYKKLFKEKDIKYEKAIERKDYGTANKITIPLFRDLYQFSVSHQQKDHGF